MQMTPPIHLNFLRISILSTRDLEAGELERDAKSNMSNPFVMATDVPLHLCQIQCIGRLRKQYFGERERCMHDFKMEC